ncbi:glycosyltransferase family 4 protein [Verrucomicrobium sp. GAS474]|uniref:glycosyltransferase family 4 protein n=1 Tax=Verrucomicrobium sp. GAS474 TaxID=1882831 RepID=UPI00138FB515|nr:glycosyltransferase family 4 protein [Verrucomicrobium sp. GAS474]
MRITIAQGAFFPVPPVEGGAVERAWFGLGKAFAAAGHEVVHLSKADARFPVEESIGGVRHRRVPGFATPRSLFLLKALDLLYSLRLLRHLPEADILVTNTFWLPFLVRWRKRGALYVHVGRYPKGQLRLYRHAARWQTVSAPIGQAIRDQEPGRERLVSVIPYPLDEESFAGDAASPVPAREKVVLYVGRIHPEKGIGLLLDGWRRAALDRQGWRLRIVGPWKTGQGGGGEDYAHVLREKGVEGVEWVGPVFERAALAAAFRHASLFVYPSLAEQGETFGLAPLEAMAQGCPALVSHLDCFGDFIEEGVTGWRFDHRVGDPAGMLAAALQRIASDEAERQAVALRARARADDFRIERIARLYLADFERALTPPEVRS